MPTASRGAAGRGLALRMLLPVGVIVTLVAHRTLVGVRAHVSAHILCAHVAEIAFGRSANPIKRVIRAAGAAGAGGFSRGVLSGAHANIVTHSW